METKTRVPDEIIADLTVLTEERTAEILTLSLNSLKTLRRKGIGPRVTVLSTGRLGYRAKDVREWLDAQAQTGETDMNHDTTEDAAELAEQFDAALRCYVQRDFVGWAQIVNASRFPVKVFAAAAFNVISQMVGEARDPEQFMSVIAEIIRRD